MSHLNGLKILLLILGFAFIAPGSTMAKIDLVTLKDRTSVQTTIYNKADLTLVRDNRVLSFKKGMNQLQFSWANTKIDPTSLMLEIKQHSDKIEIIEVIYPSGTKDVCIWNIQTSQAIVAPVEITYFTSGISWQSYYFAFLSKNQKIINLKGYVTVTNSSGEDYDNAQTRLVVGKVNILDKIAHLSSLKYPYGRPESMLGGMKRKDTLKKGIRVLDAAMPMMVMESDASEPRPKKIDKQGLSEYFLYSIEGKESIPDGWSKRLLSFEADSVNVKNMYKYESNRYGDMVVRFLVFENKKETNLGQTPLPGGEIKVFKQIGKKSKLDYIGSDITKYIPVGKKVELNLGKSLDVTIKPKTIGFKKENIIFDKKGNISGFDEVKEIEIDFVNFTDTASILEYVKNIDSTSFNISKISTHELFEKVDQDTIKFKISLKPHSSKKIKFTLTIKRGERRWQ